MWGWVCVGGVFLAGVASGAEEAPATTRPADAKQAAEAKPAADAQPAFDAKGIEFFEKKIRPVLVQHCYKCHSAESDKIKGGLQVDSRDGLLKGGETGPSIVPGNPAKSLLIDALRHDGLMMPPDKKLGESVVADFQKWIELGAPDPRKAVAKAGGAPAAKKEINWDEARRFWSFQPVANPKPPAVKDAKWPAGDIDRFLLARMEAAGVKPVADADRRSLIRRLSFDLIGLPPTAEEVEAFAADRSPQAVEKAVDRLLASPQFGERWGRHWLDVARFAESNGNVDNGTFPHAWRYRDWVIQAFNQDKPFDRFITEQIAGDLLAEGAKTPAERNGLRVATTLLALASKPRAQNNPDFALDLVSDQIEVTSVAFMGLTIGCARCHDHKFDPIPQAEYYSLAGIFESSQMLYGANQGRGGNNNRNAPPGGLHTLEFEDAAAAQRAEEHRRKVDEIKAALEATGRELTALGADVEGATQVAGADKNAKNNKKLSKKEQKQQERQEAKKKDKPDSEKTKSEKKDPAEEAKIASLTETFRDLQKQLAELEKSAPAPAGFAMGLREGRVTEGLVRLRGETQRPGDRVPRGFVTVGYLGERPPVAADQSGRLQLAQWIASRNNPLTARVLVNRLWRQLFGQGLVRTVDNFGTLGEKPSHPELLDHLATRFMDQGWSVKRAIRAIVLSRSYQLSSAHDPQNIVRDPDNTLVWRHAVRRLDGESLRDALLATAGTLDLTPAVGSPVAKSGGQLVQNGNGGQYAGFEHKHRSVYLPMVRNSEPEMLTIFDLPDTELVIGDRSVTTVPAQGLFLLNSPFVQAAAKGLAERVLAGGADDGARLTAAYRLALQRAPTDAERQRFVDALAAASGGKPADVWAAACHALLASAEFRYLE